MSPEDVIREAQEYASEYLEEVDDPKELLIYVLASELSAAQNRMEYLERRLSYVAK